MWTGNNITRPFRVAGAAALAPFIDKGLKKIQNHFKFPNLGYAFALVVSVVAASCLIVVGLLILSRWWKWVEQLLWQFVMSAWTIHCWGLREILMLYWRSILMLSWWTLGVLIASWCNLQIVALKWWFPTAFGLKAKSPNCSIQVTPLGTSCVILLNNVVFLCWLYTQICLELIDNLLTFGVRTKHHNWSCECILVWIGFQNWKTKLRLISINF